MERTDADNPNIIHMPTVDPEHHQIKQGLSPEEAEQRNKSQGKEFNPNELLAQESRNVLTFLSGPLRRMLLTERRSGMFTHRYENAAQHSFLTTFAAMGLYALCNDRGIEPYSQIDPFFLCTQALTEDLVTTSVVGGFEPTTPETEEALTVLARSTVGTLFADLPPTVAGRFRQGWENQTYNVTNPATKLITAASLICDILFYLDEWIVGNAVLLAAAQEKVRQLESLLAPNVDGELPDPLRFVLEPMLEEIKQVVR